MSATAFKSIEVALRANLSQWSPQMKTAAKDVKGVETATASAGTTTSKFGAAASAAMIGAGMAAAAFAVKAADSYVSYGKTIMGLSRVTGEGVETMSKWNFAAQQSGVSSDTLSTGIKFLQKAMASGSAEFDKLGVSTKNADGTFRGVHDVFLDTADAISKMSNATERADAIRQIFGRNGQAMGALIMKGRDQIIAMEAEAQKYGLVLTKDNLPAIQANIKAHRQYDAAMQGAMNQIGQNVLPMLTSAFNLFASLPGPIASSIAPLAGMAGGIVLLSKAMSMLGVSMGPWSAVIALIGTGGVLIKNRMDEGTKAVESLSATVTKTTSGAKSMDDLNRIMGETREQAKGLKEEADNIHAPWDVFYKKDLRDGTKALIATSIAQAALKAEVEAYAKANGVSMDVALTAVQTEHAHKKAIEETGSATGKTAEEVKALTDANKAENDALRAQMDPLFAMTDAMNKLREAKQKERENEAAVYSAYLNYIQASQNYGQSSRAAAEALGKLNEAKAAQVGTTNDLARANLDLDVAVNNLETAFKTNGSSLEENKAILQGWVAQGRMSQEQADQVIYRFWLMAQKANELKGTNIVMGVDVNTSPFFAKLRDVWAALDATKVHINSTWGAGGIAGIGAAIGNSKRPDGARAAGGPVMAGGTYLVGERGPELFQAGMNGNIVANGKWGAWGAGHTVYEDGSYAGMPIWAKKAHDFAEAIQKQEAMRANPAMHGRPGWGSLTANPFAGWAPGADFSQWGKSQTRQLGPAAGGGLNGSSSGSDSSGSVIVNVAVNAPNYVGDQSELANAMVRSFQDPAVSFELRRVIATHEETREGSR